MSTIYSGTGPSDRRAVDTEFLEKRLDINKTYASADFDGWLFERLAVKPGMDVLDVGCGTGAQTLPFAKLVVPGGSVSALDISASSIELLKRRLPAGAPVEAVATDMAALSELIETKYRVKSYDLAHSSYALYYSPKRLDVLDTMRRALKPGGRCAIFTPIGPHGLVDLAARFTKVPEPVFDSLRFGTTVLEPYFRANFKSVDVHRFHNEITLPSSDVLIEFYRQTTYHDPAAETAMRAVADKAIAENGRYVYEKNGYLIIGTN